MYLTMCDICLRILTMEVKTEDVAEDVKGEQIISFRKFFCLPFYEYCKMFSLYLN